MANSPLRDVDRCRSVVRRVSRSLRIVLLRDDEGKLECEDDEGKLNGDESGADTLVGKLLGVSELPGSWGDELEAILGLEFKGLDIKRRSSSCGVLLNPLPKFVLPGLVVLLFSLSLAALPFPESEKSCSGEEGGSGELTITGELMLLGGEDSMDGGRWFCRV